MKNLVLSALLIAAVSQAAGCIIVGGDDDTGAVNTSWTLTSADANGNAIAAVCPVGATSAIIYSLAVGAPVGDAYIDKYLCGDGGGQAADLPAGDYYVWVRLTDTSETIRYAESGSQIVHVSAGGAASAPFSIMVDHAYYLVGWALVPPGGGSLACSQVVGENGVSITATDGGGALLDTVVDCEVGEGGLQTYSRPLPSSLSGAQYTIAISLLDANDNSIGDAPTIPASAANSLDYGNEYQDLGFVNIALQ